MLEDRDMPDSDNDEELEVPVAIADNDDNLACADPVVEANEHG